MNLSEIRDAIIAEADLGTSQSAEFKARLNGFINRALYRISLDAPHFFFEDMVRFATAADRVPLSATDLISIDTGDPWTWSTDLLVGSPLATQWSTNGTWDGRLVQIKGADDIWRDNRIRSVWQGGNRFRFTTWQPWHNTTEVNAEWRVADEFYYLPDDVVRVHSMRLDDLGNTTPLRVIWQDVAEDAALLEVLRNNSAGQPDIAFRRERWQLKFQPVVAPTALLTGDWVGPERMGQFYYVYTYVWGYRDLELSAPGPTSTGATGSFPEPLWESTPSPAVTITPTGGAPAGTGQRVRLTFPDVEFEQGFGSNVVATTRYRHSGIRIRIYRRRATSGTATAHADTPLVQETPNVYHLIGEIDGQAGTYPQWYDNGTATPDYHRRLREVHGYHAVGVHPRPNDRYIVDCRVTRRPQKLLDDNDVPTLHVEAMDALIFKTLAMLKRQERDYATADGYEKSYGQVLLTLNNNFGDLKHASRPEKRRIARAERGRGWKRWYTLPTS